MTVSWSTDLSGGIQRVAIEHGCSPYGNGKARMIAWNLPDPIPVHREPIYTPRPDLVAKYPTLPDARQFRVPNIGFTVQKAAVDNGISQTVPADPDLRPAGRVRGRRRGDALQQVARRAEAGDVSSRSIRRTRASAASRTASWVWVTGAESNSKTRMKALVTERVGKGVAWMPYHFAGWFEGVDLRSEVSEGHRSDRAGREREHADDLWLRSRRRACRSPRRLSVRSAQHEEAHLWRE